MRTLRKSPALLCAIGPVFGLIAMLPATAVAQAGSAADNTPVMLPDHHYDLPGVRLLPPISRRTLRRC